MPVSKVILIIEEDDDDRAFFSEIVVGTGLAVDLLRDKYCLDAISKMRKKIYGIPNAVFFGLGIPTDDGLMCLATLRSLLPDNIPIYVAASSLNQPTTIKIVNAGGSGVMNKSGDLQILKLQIERAVRVS